MLRFIACFSFAALLLSIPAKPAAGQQNPSPCDSAIAKSIIDQAQQKDGSPQYNFYQCGRAEDLGRGITNYVFAVRSGGFGPAEWLDTIFETQNNAPVLLAAVYMRHCPQNPQRDCARGWISINFAQDGKGSPGDFWEVIQEDDPQATIKALGERAAEGFSKRKDP